MTPHDHIVTVLLVGPAGVGKRTLAAAIRQGITTASAPRIHFRTAEVLPLPTEKQEDASDSRRDGGAKGPKIMDMLPAVSSNQENTSNEESGVKSSFRYDLILMMVDMTNKKSWTDCQKSLRYLEPSWFLGHCAVVVTKVDQVAHYAFDREEIEDVMSNFYELPVFWVATGVHQEESSELARLAKSVLRFLSVATGFIFAGTQGESRLSRKSFLPSTVSYCFTRTTDFYHTVSTVVHHQVDETDDDGEYEQEP